MGVSRKIMDLGLASDCESFRPRVCIVRLETVVCGADCYAIGLHRSVVYVKLMKGRDGIKACLELIFVAWNMCEALLASLKSVRLSIAM